MEHSADEIQRVLEIIRMEDLAKIKFKSCSLGMKQRIGVAMALLGDPALLILDEPNNGLDTDGMWIMREILIDITRRYGCTVLISSHILGELEKIATHYGIIRQGKMIQELSAKELKGRARIFVSIKTFAVGLLFFMMIPALTPLNSGITNIVMCLIGGALFSVGLGVASSMILNKTSLV